MANDPPDRRSKKVWVPSAKYWRNRAHEARSLGDEIRDPTVKAMMERIASVYDQLAANAAKRKWRTK